jgi:hypothetical protein
MTKSLLPPSHDFIRLFIPLDPGIAQPDERISLTLISAAASLRTRRYSLILGYPQPDPAIGGTIIGY